MNRYLVVTVAVLTWMVFDQAHALRQLVELNHTYEITIDDYYATIQNGCK
jgi:hypothetical protein